MREKKRVDDDWKKRAAEEKAKIAGQLDGGRSAPPPAADPVAGVPLEGDDAAAAPEGAAPPPPGVETDPVFVQLLSSLGGQAMMALGMAEDPHTGERFLDLDLARQSIDMLGSLEVRTRGNLSMEEEKLLGDVLHQLRLSYTQRVQQAQEAAMKQPPPGAE